MSATQPQTMIPRPPALTEAIVRAAYEHFMRGAEHPCSASAMGEAIALAVPKMAPASHE